jgi:NAD+ kinase
MEKIHIIGKDPEKISNLKKKISEFGFEYSEENPDVVITYGGDGMFLIAERVFPGVPKIMIKDSKICNNCCDLSIEEILEKYKKKDFFVEEIQKLKAVFRGRFESRELIGVNDIVIRNSLPTEALRFKVKKNKDFIEQEKEFIGDGVVIATPYGSNRGAYFCSITGKTFDSGFGLAFNNTANNEEPILLGNEENIEIEITRGQGVLVADNNRDFINLEQGSKIFVSKIPEVARRIILRN